MSIYSHICMVDMGVDLELLRANYMIPVGSSENGRSCFPYCPYWKKES